MTKMNEFIEKLKPRLSNVQLDLLNTFKDNEVYSYQEEVHSSMFNDTNKHIFVVIFDHAKIILEIFL
jgi:hypothetical protein